MKAILIEETVKKAVETLKEIEGVNFIVMLSCPVTPEEGQKDENMTATVGSIEGATIELPTMICKLMEKNEELQKIMAVSMGAYSAVDMKFLDRLSGIVQKAMLKAMLSGKF